MTFLRCLVFLALASCSGVAAPVDDADAGPHAGVCSTLTACQVGEHEFACVDLQTDRSNCGECGNGCAGDCIAGQCDACPLFTTLCGGRCIETSGRGLADQHHCGSCTTDCGDGFCIVPANGGAVFCSN